MSRIARALDILTIASLLLTILVIATGGFREWTPLGRVSITDWTRPLILAALLLLVRHWRYPQPHLGRRLWEAVSHLRRAPETRAVLPSFLLTRLGVLVVGFLALAVFGYPQNMNVPWRHYENEFANLPARWDTGWYTGIAVDGYQWWRTQPNYQQNIAFFPAYPLLMRYTSLFLARDLIWSGVVISWAAFLAALIYLFRFARERIGEDAATASVALICSYPFALFYSAAYTEGLFLLTIVAACYHFERDQLWRAGAWGLLAGLTRPNGCLLSIVLALLAIRPIWNGWKPSLPPKMGWGRLAFRLTIAAAPGIGMIAFSTYLYMLTGNPLQWVTANAAWGRSFRTVTSLAGAHVQQAVDNGLFAYIQMSNLDILQAAAVLLVLVAVWPVFRRFGLAYAAMILLNILPPLYMGGLLSAGRLTSVLFPVFLWLGTAIPAHHRVGWIAMFAMLQALCAAMFFTWRPLY